MSTALIITGAIVGVLIVLGYRSYKQMRNMPVTEDSANLKLLTGQNFQQQINKGVVLVDFWASWCMPCKVIAPYINKLADDFKGKASVGKLSIEQHQQIAAQYKVRSIPTMIIFKNGKEMERFSGVKSHDFLTKQMQKYL